jgi:DNA-binding NtrC family response regulator
MYSVEMIDSTEMKAQKDIVKIAIVEDDVYYNKILLKYVQTICNQSSYPQYEFEFFSFYNAHDCIEQMDEDLDIMILDYLLINEEEDDVLNAMDVIRELKRMNSECKVILFSGQQSAHTTIELMKAGIYEYIDKSVNGSDRIGAVIHRILAKRAS